MTLTRRTLLVSAGVIGAGAALGGVTAPSVAAATDTWDAPGSDNGWTIDPDVIERFRIEGSPATVRLHPDAAAILLHVARRWHYEVGPLTASRDVVGHRADRTVRAAFESNHLSGTAIALHPLQYPLGAGDGMWPHHRTIVRDILADCEGLVRWGGDLSPVAEGHFQIDAKPGAKDLTRLAKTLDVRAPRHDGPRPGAVEDPMDRARRAKARRLARTQRGT
ncbi:MULTISPECIES: M15 family metallopeptidase [unclassified Streptomyces]|uniref:M15 family metallopeptidase n=1 Tax=unclassified Streptomyces TaxID=2593676 RepID=UPI000F6E4E06|nr:MULTISPECIES: M15 family metallopeptidase [unclassified Streptomyces]AZM60459.1 hypothetical protein DLM49_13585 [Streptomyces sp. WAC 01438]RSM98570.1 hypothetical protein DMA10_09045 [Streptomyces sp. WAC 01420]